MHLCPGYGYELTPLAMLESERNVSARTMPTSVACTVIYSQGVLQMHQLLRAMSVLHQCLRLHLP